MSFSQQLLFIATAVAFVAIDNANCHGQGNLNFPSDVLKVWSEANSTLGSSDYTETIVITRKYHQTFSDKRPKGAIESISWTVRLTGDMFLEAGVPTEVDTTEFNGSVSCVNDEYSFELSKNERSNPWFVTSLLKGDDKEKSSVRRYGKLVRKRRFNSIYFRAFWPCTLAEIFESEYCQVLKAEPVFNIGKQLFEVQFSINNAPTSEFPPIELGIIRFDPSRKWIPISWEINFQGGGKRIGNNSQFVKRGQFHIPRLQTWQAYNRDGHMLEEIEYKQNLRFVKSPRYDFSLGAFGIPEISDNFKKPPFPYFTVTVVSIAVMALLAAFWFMRKSK